MTGDMTHVLALGVKAQMGLIQALSALQQQAPAVRQQSALSWLDEAEKQIAEMRQALTQQA